MVFGKINFFESRYTSNSQSGNDQLNAMRSLSHEKSVTSLNLCKPAFSQPLLLSLSTGTFPAAENAVVTPLLKKPNLDLKNSLKNYRPVSNTAFLSKIIEKTALIRVSEHIDNNELHCKV